MTFLVVVALVAFSSSTPRSTVQVIPAVPMATTSRTDGPSTEAPSRAPTATSSPEATPRPSSSAPVPRRSSLAGVASWYRWRSNEAAAGPGLRRALGARWRGSIVQVCARGRCVAVRLTDWCGCPDGRLIDLDARSFAELAPLSRGLVDVEVRV